MGIAKQAKYCILFYDFTKGVRAPRGKRSSNCAHPIQKYDADCEAMASPLGEVPGIS